MPPEGEWVMRNEFSEEAPRQSKAETSGTPERGTGDEAASGERGAASGWLSRLLQIGLGESLLRAGTSVLSVTAIVLVAWFTQVFYAQARVGPAAIRAQQAESTAAAQVEMVGFPEAPAPESMGISRAARIHTNVPARARQEITIYEVQKGDTVFGIAEKYGLQPATILWSNYNTLLDDPHSLQPGQELFILPVDGVFWEWLGGIPFGEWATFYGVAAEEVINFPGNKLDPNVVGDPQNANIPTGTWLIIPGGTREFVNWSAPLGVTRENPASARVLGPGACDPVAGGSIGYGTYVWPANKHYLSGFDYSEKANHRGIDLAGSEGEGAYAADAGVVVYSGWNNYGYGNMMMVDHGNGWQSLYAHLSAIYRGCGASVGQGEAIGAIGSTGRSSGAHLHFELMAGAKVNPWDYLPPP
jgi:murein DD-endopeptidase MepM/ murein hydrolase activator NlpD